VFKAAKETREMLNRARAPATEHARAAS